MREADVLLDSAPAALKKTGAWHVMKLSFAMQMGEPRGAGGKVFQSAVAAWPNYERVYKTAISLSMPQWGGNFADVESVVRYAYDNTNATEGATRYANLYTDTFLGSSRYTLRQSDVDWELMKKGFRDAMGKAGTDGRLFGFASMACQMQDREEAKRLYALIDELPLAKRPKNTTTDPCRMFANGADPKGMLPEFARLLLAHAPGGAIAPATLPALAATAAGNPPPVWGQINQGYMIEAAGFDK